MADIILPAVALGALYLTIKKNNEGFKGRENKKEYRQYPVKKKEEAAHINEYKGGKTIAEKYFSDKTEETGEISSLTGSSVNAQDFKHNNMVPFFGSKTKGNINTHEGILDSTQGQGTHYIKKSEQAPLFKPHTNLSHAHGAPNSTDFIRSRMNPSNKMANVKPWEEKRVAPGLNMGYTTEGSNMGFNTGMEHRDVWKPKNVDELRVATNPKLTYSLDGLQGAASSNIKEYHNIGHQGKIENHAPPTFYENTCDRWFTTTGNEKRETQRGEEMMGHVNRPETSQSYFGGQRTQNEKSYVKGKFMDSRRNQVESNPQNITSVKGPAPLSETDYGNGSYRNNNNNRNNKQEYLGLNGILKASISPLVDVLKPTKKSEVINNIRQEGNINGGNRLQDKIYNPNDKLKTTIRQQIETKIEDHLNYQGTKKDGYHLYTPDDREVNRSSTSRSYEGGAGPASISNLPSYVSAYNQNNNDLKEQNNRINTGNMDLYNGSMNATLRDDVNESHRKQIITTTNANVYTPNLIGKDTLVNPRQETESLENNRMNSDILDAFKENPYTKNLHSI